MEGMTKTEIVDLIFLDPNFFFHGKYETSYAQLLHDNLVEDEQDFDALGIVVIILIRHICASRNGRCLKPRGPNNELTCRTPRFSESTMNYFNEK